MFLDSLTVFHIVWKSHKNCEFWLVGFWVTRHSQMPKISVNNFFLPFLSSCYGFINCYEIIENFKIQFCSLFGWFFKNFAHKTYGTLKMFLLSTTNNFSIILYLYVHVQKNSSLNFMSLFVSRPPISACFFGNIFKELFWKSLLGRKSSLELPVFWFSNIPPYDLEESEELRDWIRWVLGLEAFKNATKFSADKHFLRFWAAIMDLWIVLKY